jgi:peptidoglycan hydrolase CwlO-like protein
MTGAAPHHGTDVTSVGLPRSALCRSLLVLAAVVTPVVAPAAPARADTITAPAPVQNGSPSLTDLPVLMGIPMTSLVQRVESRNEQVQEVKQEESDQAAEERRITNAIDGYNKRAATYDSETATANQEAADVGSQIQALNTAIDEHNAQPHDFLIPRDQEAADAYQNQADQLNARKSKLDDEKNAVNDEQSQLEQEQGQLTTEKEQLTATITQFNAKNQELQARVQQLAAEGQELLAEIADAEQSLTDSPPDPAAAMDQGGDAAAPPEQADTAASPAAAAASGPGDDPAGGDTPSQQPQRSALKAYAQHTGVPVVLQPGTAYLSPDAIRALPASQAAQLGAPTGRYDGLVRQPDGTYSALEVQTPGAAVSPQQAAFNAAVRSGKKVTTITIGNQRAVITHITPVPMTSPYWTPHPGPQGPPGSGKAACLTRFQGERSGGGWIRYTTTPVPKVDKDISPPNGPGVRPGQATACLAAPIVKGSVAASTDITGWKDAYKKAPTGPLARCHLIANDVGGKGTGATYEESNLVPCWQIGTNITRFGMRPFETLVAKAADQDGAYGTLQNGSAVYYVVTPIYRNARSTIPEAITVEAWIEQPDGARWPLFFPDTIENVERGGSTNLGN